MNDSIKSASVLLISFYAVVASSVYVYTNIIKDNREIRSPSTTVNIAVTPTLVDRVYKDGIYFAEGNYITNGGKLPHKMEVKVALTNNQISDAMTELKDDSLNASAVKRNDKFVEELRKVVIGKKLNDVKDLDKLAGASDTTKAFKEAVEKIKSQDIYQ